MYSLHNKKNISKTKLLKRLTNVFILGLHRLMREIVIRIHISYHTRNYDVY